LLAEVFAGDEAAVDKLVRLYLTQLVAVGRRKYQKLGDVPRPVEDEEDAALSALQSFCARASAGKLHDFANRHELWALLVKITIRKIGDQVQRAKAKKRGGDVLVKPADALEEVVSQLPPPEAAAELEDTTRAALAALDDPELRQIAEMRLEGRTGAEIAELRKRSVRTIIRKLKDIREEWDHTFAADR
jgi:DNA-directed RNA polymerase specialized sigma24 family protein